MNVQYGRAKWTPFDQLNTPRTPIPCERDALPDLGDHGRAKLGQLTFARTPFISLHAEHLHSGVRACKHLFCTCHLCFVRAAHTATIRVLLPHAHAHV
jgi:hypothetical protein